MTKIINIDIGYVSIFDNYIIMEIDQGVIVTKEHNQLLVDIVDKFYKDKGVVYISNRKNSYSVNPSVYYETNKIKNIIGLAVVSENGMAVSNAEIEKLFFNKPFEIFSNLEDAKNWANELYKKMKKN
ncbi:hypothetical protein CLV86_2783 [Lacinutrix venerupis]|uniref:hypothetical protein n=1 Tax=Lacinutrix venerupis TaxID=1486034 RepID=UPI000EADFF08|nr:hypothetical protein [Lacinutrix venerupis]RLJ60933.1 hypothetical protein CLV86_2783 [Lacinutrix venerupis]